MKSNRNSIRFDCVDGLLVHCIYVNAHHKMLCFIEEAARMPKEIKFMEAEFVN